MYDKKIRKKNLKYFAIKMDNNNTSLTSSYRVVYVFVIIV